MVQSSSLDSLQDPVFSSRWQQCHYDAKHDRGRMGTKISRRPNCKSENSTHGNHGPVQLIQDIYIYMYIYIILFAYVTILLIVGRNPSFGSSEWAHQRRCKNMYGLTQKGTMQCLKVMGKKGRGSCRVLHLARLEVEGKERPPSGGFFIAAPASERRLHGGQVER